MTVLIRKTEEIQIRELLENWVVALQSKDVEALIAHYEPQVLLYDIAPPLRQSGEDNYRKNWEEWFASFQGPIGYEIRDLSISAGSDIAFSTSLNHISGNRTTGEDTDVWVRVTVGYRKQSGQWRVAHAHISVPFYMDGSFKAAIDLSPDPEIS